MYQLQIDKANAIVDCVLDGYIPEDEMQRFLAELKAATTSLPSREIGIKVDLRSFKPASPEVANMISDVHNSGVRRVAEMVDSQIVALHLNQVARERGTQKSLRRFWEDAEALHWLIHGDAGESSAPG